MKTLSSLITKAKQKPEQFKQVINPVKVEDILRLLIWEFINPFFLKLKKSKRYNFDYKYKGINLAGGKTNPKEYLNVDGGVRILMKYIPSIFSRYLFRYTKMSKYYSSENYIKSSKAKNVIHHELLYGIPFEDNSIPAIYSSHFLEHIF